MQYPLQMEERIEKLGGVTCLRACSTSKHPPPHPSRFFFSSNIINWKKRKEKKKPESGIPIKYYTST